MKTFISLFLAFIIIPSLFAQEQSQRKGKKAIQFDVDGVSLINGSIHGVAGKYWWTDNLATRAGLQFGIESYKDEFSDQTDREVDNINTKLIFGIEKYLKSIKKISPYFGAEIGVLLEKQHENENTVNEVKWSHQDISIGLLFGVEYWINSNISLSGCHKIDLQYYKYQDNIKSHNTPLIELNLSTTCLTLSIYL